MSRSLYGWQSSKSLQEKLFCSQSEQRWSSAAPLLEETTVVLTHALLPSSIFCQDTQQASGAYQTQRAWRLCKHIHTPGFQVRRYGVGKVPERPSHNTQKRRKINCLFSFTSHYVKMQASSSVQSSALLLGKGHFLSIMINRKNNCRHMLQKKSNKSMKFDSAVNEDWLGSVGALTIIEIPQYFG